eukprot:2252-Heterococcus_DN1.PRE.2
MIDTFFVANSQASKRPDAIGSNGKAITDGDPPQKAEPAACSEQAQQHEQQNVRFQMNTGTLALSTYTNLADCAQQQRQQEHPNGGVHCWKQQLEK